MRIRLALVTSVLCGCSSYQEVSLDRIVHVELTELNGQGMTMRVEATITNPNGYRLKVVDPDVDVSWNGKLLGKATLDSSLSLPRRSSQVHSIPLRATWTNGLVPALLMGLGALFEGQGEVSFKGTVVGKAGLLRKRFPFEITEPVDLR
ncbi:MAG: LEA type 2 family protein [Flavobacteriales bacterium]|nr:LEA type 2 family protein [Flavobacteriales bacterium]